IKLGLGSKIIMQVGLGQLRAGRDLGRRGAAETALGEYRLGGLQKPHLVAFADIAPAIGTDFAEALPLRRLCRRIGRPVAFLLPGHVGRCYRIARHPSSVATENLTIWSDRRYRARQ